MTGALRAVFPRLEALYESLSRETEAGPGCRACGSCCHFDVMDHVVYCSRLEAMFLLEGAPWWPRVRPAPGRCPGQAEKTCAARRWRPLGCRLYLCGPAAAADGAQDDGRAERWHRALKAIHEEADLPWDYRPLLQWSDAGKDLYNGEGF